MRISIHHFSGTSSLGVLTYMYLHYTGIQSGKVIRVEWAQGTEIVISIEAHHAQKHQARFSQKPP